jgi:preprotein translocase YajC subunit
MLNNLMANWTSWIMMGALLVLIVVFMVFNRRTQAKKQKEAADMLNAIKPGNKVKTIGGICGVVVEICPEDNSFVLETGTEQSGKSYIKFDKQAVYQTDAVVKTEEKTENKEEK